MLVERDEILGEATERKQGKEARGCRALRTSRPPQEIRAGDEDGRSRRTSREGNEHGVAKLSSKPNLTRKERGPAEGQGEGKGV